jgi:ABC-type enterochelin transport system permease subunit
MSGLQTVKSWVGSLTEVALMLLALGIALALLAGPQVPFLGNVVGNIVAMVNELGKNGIVGLIALGIILWLFSNRSVS